MTQVSNGRQPSPPAATVSELADDPPIAAMEDGGAFSYTFGPTVKVEPKDYSYEVVKGFFIQDGPFDGPHPNFETDVLPHSFGLVDQSPERWQNLRSGIARLQRDAPVGVQYKVFFLARHGQGWHNLGANIYGASPWETKWTFLNGDGKITWGPDPSLTPLGVEQAQMVHAAWLREAPFGAPIGREEMKWYCSPLLRTAQTLVTTWGELLAGQPEVWEDWREVIGAHTCDKRNNRSVLEAQFPNFIVEPDMSEEDPRWTPRDRESDTQMQARMLRAMDRLFGPNGTEKTFVSVTAHSAILTQLLAVLGHCPYPLWTGEMIPVVVKATPIAEP